MDYTLLDKEPLPGFGSLYQGGDVDSQIYNLPGPLVIVNMNRDVDDVPWVKRTYSPDLEKDDSHIQGVLHIGIADMDQATLPSEVFLALVEAGYSLLSRGVNLYVHCQLGYSRSSYYTVALYMRMGLSFKDAIKHVRATRKDAFPNWGFYDHLEKLYGAGRFTREDKPKEG